MHGAEPGEKPTRRLSGDRTGIPSTVNLARRRRHKHEFEAKGRILQRMSASLHKATAVSAKATNPEGGRTRRSSARRSSAGRTTEKRRYSKSVRRAMRCLNCVEKI